MKIYVYEDWTKEEVPRCFYVGKGNSNRLRNMNRNRKHSNVSNKHGIDRKVIAEFDDNADACFMEIELIKLRSTYHYNDPSGVGCNFTLGGEGSLGVKLSDERKAALSRANSKPKSAETREKMRLAVQRRANDPTWRMKMSIVSKGRVMSESTRKKLSDALKGKKLPEEHRLAIIAGMSDPEVRLKQSEPNKRENLSAERLRSLSEQSSKRVVQCDLDGNPLKEYPSITQASRSLGISGSAISHVLHGRAPSCRGYVWKFAAPEVGERPADLLKIVESDDQNVER